MFSLCVCVLLSVFPFFVFGLDFFFWIFVGLDGLNLFSGFSWSLSCLASYPFFCSRVAHELSALKRKYLSFVICIQVLCSSQRRASFYSLFRFCGVYSIYFYVDTKSRGADSPGHQTVGKPVSLKHVYEIGKIKQQVLF